MKGHDEAAVVLFQLGGPDSLDAVEPFLYNLFCDPDIINFPGAFLARKFIARKISSSRSKIVTERYREIGGKSPILDLTKAQATALENVLRKKHTVDVYIAMRYWHPLTAEVITEMKRRSYKKIILLPLYPQFSQATTVSSVKEWERQARAAGYTKIPTEMIESYHNHRLYIGAIIENIQATVARFRPDDAIDLVFSAHGIPISLVAKGDPYKAQIEETVRLVVDGGRWAYPHHLCYQSKVGPAEWLKPSLDETITRLGAEGRRNLLVVPVAFVTEHIETLHEINIEARELAMRSGIRRFEMMPALNDNPKFIGCLEELVVGKL